MQENAPTEIVRRADGKVASSRGDYQRKFDELYGMLAQGHSFVQLRKYLTEKYGYQYKTACDFISKFRKYISTTLQAKREEYRSQQISMLEHIILTCLGEGRFSEANSAIRTLITITGTAVPQNLNVDKRVQIAITDYTQSHQGETIDVTPPEFRDEEDDGSHIESEGVSVSDFGNGDADSS